jgi:KUP system potassium uptake protein
MAVGGAAAFLVVDLGFLAANVSKIAHGGWFPLLIALGVYTVLSTWRRGREIVTRNRTAEEGPLRAFVDEVHAMDPPVYRAPRTAVFLSPSIETTPLALRANVEHNHVLHEHVVIMSIKTLKMPHVDIAEQLTIDDLGYRDDGINHVTACFGFLDTQNVPNVLGHAADKGLERKVDTENLSYFLSRITIVVTDAPGMRMWRKRLFVAIAHNAADPAEFFGLPLERTIVMGAHIEI